MGNLGKRRDMDVMKLMMRDYKVETVTDGLNDFNVEFKGPRDSPYSGWVWKIHVEIPVSYPYKPPFIGFLNRIYHPNVDEMSGSVCLDVLNQSWSPMFDLLNIFEVFLPQLLLYPNPTDPLNGEAAALMMHDRNLYDQRVKEHSAKYAESEVEGNKQEEESSSDEVSDDEYSSCEDEMTGHTYP